MKKIIRLAAACLLLGGYAATAQVTQGGLTLHTTLAGEGVQAFNDMVERQGKDSAFKAMAAGTPLARFAKAEEIAAQIAFLLSEDSAFMTGACLVSDGGYSL